MTLFELSKEYDRAVENLEILIQKYSSILREYPPNSHEAYNCKVKIRDFVMQRNHLKEVAAHLRNYYRQ